jgi:hypothetical protein
LHHSGIEDAFTFPTVGATVDDEAVDTELTVSAEQADKTTIPIKAIKPVFISSSLNNPIC